MSLMHRVEGVEFETAAGIGEDQVHPAVGVSFLKDVSGRRQVHAMNAVLFSVRPVMGVAEDEPSHLPRRQNLPEGVGVFESRDLLDLGELGVVMHADDRRLVLLGIECGRQPFQLLFANRPGVPLTTSSVSSKSKFAFGPSTTAACRPPVVVASGFVVPNSSRKWSRSS